MGKRSKKSSRALHKGKPAMVYSQRSVAEQCIPHLDPFGNGDAESEGRKSCPHINKHFEMNKLLERLGSPAILKCEDCRDSLPNRKGSKGKRKNVKAEGCSSSSSKSKLRAIWVCLECAHHACGGVGLPAEPQSHAIRHARKTRHSLMIQLDSPHLLWCIHCNAPIPLETTKNSLHTSGVFYDLVHFVEARVSEWSMHSEDVVVDGDDVALASHTNGGGGGGASNQLAHGCKNTVRGLVNLGNTCFFNSILQNILAMGKLRVHFSNQDVSVGPLSMSLKKLFAETEVALSPGNVLNPGSFFSSLASKAPRFRGHQQHDSHELLCYLLDRLSAEELGFRKQAGIHEEDGNSSKLGPAYIEAVFGGQFCSTVCCVECGHSSTVYEAFLDLSLPVPMKKNSGETKAISRTKKKKCPPGRATAHRRKPNGGTNSALQQRRNSSPSFCNESPNESQSTICDGEFAVALSGESMISNSLSPIAATLECGGLVSHSSCSSVVEYEDQMASLGKSAARMDYFGPEAESRKLDDESIFQTDGIPISQYSGHTFMGLKSSFNESFQCSVAKEQSPRLDPSHALEDVLLQVQSSDVLLLPYRGEKDDEDGMTAEAEASSFVVGNEQVEVGLDGGIGILFGEPEASEMLAPRSSLDIDVAETGIMMETNSESDPDEVDDADSPVHLETCLNHYIKPELLTGDNAWECENCSKMLRSLEQNAKQIGKRAAPESSVAEGEYLVPLSQNHDGPNQNCAEDEHHQVREMESLYPLEYLKYNKNGQFMELPKFFEPVPNSCDFIDTANNGDTVSNAQHAYCLGNCDPGEHEHGKTCIKLNLKKSATKRALIAKAPPILTIHLKRFNQDAHGRLSKLNGHVEFGEIIDLSPYMDFRCENTEEHLYRLLGVVEHTGSMRGGHYVAYIRGSKKRSGEEKEGARSAWYLANDSHVHEVSLEEVFGSEAYILFYERI